MNIEGVVVLLPDAGSASGSGSDTNSRSDDGIEIYGKKATMNTTSCLSLYHGWNIIGEIYPWYQFRTIEVSWSGIKVCNYNMICTATYKYVYHIWQNIRRGKLLWFSWIFSPTTKDFPCMFCMLVALIHYSDGMMVLAANLQNFPSKRYFFRVTAKVFPLKGFAVYSSYVLLLRHICDIYS